MRAACRLKRRRAAAWSSLPALRRPSAGRTKSRSARRGLAEPGGRQLLNWRRRMRRRDPARRRRRGGSSLRARGRISGRDRAVMPMGLTERGVGEGGQAVGAPGNAGLQLCAKDRCLPRARRALAWLDEAEAVGLGRAEPGPIASHDDGADQASDGGLVGEDADDFGPSLDLPVQPFNGVCAMQFGAMFPL